MGGSIKDGFLQFDTKGNAKQKECAEAWVDDKISQIYYFGVKGAAKSYTGCSLIFGNALIYPETKYFIARKNLNDLRKYTTPTIKEVLDNFGIPKNKYKYNGKDDYWTLDNGSEVYYVSADREPQDPTYRRFGSLQFTRGWAEEIGEIELAAIQNLGATIGRWKNGTYGLVPKMLNTGNPCQNFAYDIYKSWKNGTLPPHVKFIETDANDNKAISEGYYANLERVLSDEQKQRLLRNNWDYSNDPTCLCDSEAINDMFFNEFVEPTGETYISADLAMRGRDRFVAAPWNGLVCDLTKGIDQAQSTGKSIEQDLKTLMIRAKVPRSRVIADSDGLGNYLESYLEGINEFRGNSPPVNDKYNKLKSECGFKLAELINKREIRIICSQEQRDRIARELTALKADYDIEGKQAIISKKIMKRDLSSSPDYLDMLLMRMWFELKPEPTFDNCLNLVLRDSIDDILGLSYEDDREFTDWLQLE